MTTLLCVNPHARNGDIDTASIVAALEQLGPVEQLHGPASETLADALASASGKIERVVIGGGDGTINAALPALLAAQLPVGVLPLGTANDFARALGVNDSVDVALAAILGGTSKPADIGEVNGHFFVNAVGLGLGPRLTRIMDKEEKRHLGVLAYLKNLLTVIGEKRRNRADITVDGRLQHLPFVQITIACSPYYGGGLTVSEHNRLGDGLLHLLALKPLSPWAMIKQGIRMRIGTVSSDRQTITAQGELVQIRTSRTCEVTADGELIGQSPITCSLHKAALRVFVPDEMANDNKIVGTFN